MFARRISEAEVEIAIDRGTIIESYDRNAEVKILRFAA
jgi:hypothetical protein